MDYNSFRDLAIRSSDIYYQFLEDNNKGLSVSEVSRILVKDTKVYLYVKGRLSAQSLETIKLLVYSDIYENEICCPIDYESNRGILLLRPKKNILALLSNIACDHVKVISDLRFLVRRVRDWYHFHPDPLTIPTASPLLPAPRREDMVGSPSDEQYTAVCGVMTSPFSYVWGAPGTGKTRFVLANCVLSYLRADMRVYLLAPTNNALEQMLRGVLDVISNTEIPLNRIRRLGLPSPAFYEQYPEVCEYTASEQKKTYLSVRILALEKQLKALEKFEKLGRAFDSISALEKEWNETMALHRNSLVPAQEIRAIREHLAERESESARMMGMIREFSVWESSFSGKLCKFFLPSRFLEKETAARNCEQQSRKAEDICCDLRKSIASLNNKNSEEREAFLGKLRDVTARYIALCRLYNCSPPIGETNDDPQVLSEALAFTIEDIREDKDTAADEIEEHLSQDLQTVRSQLEKSTSDLAAIESGESSGWEDVRVVAMTIDKHLSAKDIAFTPDHVFMDEAAYCSLIKGYTLLSYGCPLTLLGDHMQLPPVCEMSGEQIDKEENRSVFLWSQSAIYIESAFSMEFTDLYQQCKKTEPPIIADMQRHDLSVTYRFGSVLSGLLERFVYQRTFTSATKDGTEIQFIHAPSSPTDEKRSSVAECVVIQELARELSGTGEDYAILTPYRDQIRLLTGAKGMRSLASSGNILTVHASQGREFDTVILSVVDTSRKYFTNSSIAVGRTVLNTAISRTKKRLILVLDWDYWRTQENQLIGNLLVNATPYQLNVSNLDTP